MRGYVVPFCCVFLVCLTACAERAAVTRPDASSAAAVQKADEQRTIEIQKDIAPAAVSAAQQHYPFEQLFGYQAFPATAQDFPVHIKDLWASMLRAEQRTPCLPSCLSPADAPHWHYLAGKASTMDELALLRTVNAFFNKFPYASDMENYGVADHWPTLADFFSRRSGDCRAYASAKYFALRALGIPDDKLRIVLLMHVPTRKANHAVLAVDTSRGVFILDSHTRPIDLILPQEKFSLQFIPFFMFNEKGRWTFKDLRKR